MVPQRSDYYIVTQTIIFSFLFSVKSSDVDVEKLSSNSSLEEVDLQDNPLTFATWHKLNSIKTFTIILSPAPSDGLDDMD